MNNIKDKLIGLNYFGKKLDSTRNAVIDIISEELNVSKINVQMEIEKMTEERATQPKRKVKEALEDNRPVSAGSMSHSEQLREVKPNKFFLITAAQNNTPVHKDFLLSLEKYADYLDAELLVFPFIYNKSAFQNGEGDSNIWYDPALTEYMQGNSLWLGEGNKVTALAFNILPTAKSPLSGIADSMGSAEAVIVPHATLAHECIAVLGAQYGATVRQMYTTGCVTQRNYIQQRAGNNAENRHNFAALIVEFNEFGQYWIRQIETDETGEFYDLKNAVYPHSISENIDSVSVFNPGDIHAEKIDEKIASAIWGDNGMIDYFKPDCQMFHDICDFSALNHHNRENHFHLAENHIHGRTVQADMQDISKFLQLSNRWYCQSVIVRSNHDTAITRWLSDGRYDPRKDPANAKLYHQLQVENYTCLERGEYFNDLEKCLQLTTGDDFSHIQFLRASESFKVGPVELGEHGHSGVNGSRGSPKQFRSQSVTTGHTHSSSIYGSAYTAGVTGKLAMGYNESGASSWVQAHVIQYRTGKRAIIHTKDRGDGVIGWTAQVNKDEN